MKQRFFIWAVLGFVGLVIALACGFYLSRADERLPVNTEGQIAPPIQGGTLNVLTFPAMATWWMGRDDQPSGIEVELVEAFARQHQWQVKWVVVHSRKDLFEKLANGHGHLAAAGLPLLDERSDRFLIGPAFLEVVEQVACHFKHPSFPENKESLQRVALHVEWDSMFAHSLNQWDEQEQLALNIQLRGDVLTGNLMRQVADQHADCLVADSVQLKAMRRVYPDLRIAMDLPYKRKLGWYFPKSANELNQLAQKWAHSKAGKQVLAQAKRNHLDYIADFDFVEMQVLHRRIRDRLPRYKQYFLEAEQQTGLSASLLAAVAYQESHWNPKATSPTGVRGLMMLTQRTAKSLGVEDRLDPWASIEGGARYLKDRYERQSDAIS